MTDQEILNRRHSDKLLEKLTGIINDLRGKFDIVIEREHATKTENALMQSDIRSIKGKVVRHEAILMGNGEEGLITSSKLMARDIKNTDENVQDIKDELKWIKRLIVGAVVSGVISAIIGGIVLLITAT